MSLRIEDYALIGNTRTAALVGCNGSIDWLCLPRFDSDACFAALLGTAENGHGEIAPQGEVTAVRRHYRGATMVLETVMETAAGTVALIDLMPCQETENRVDLIRLVEGRRGSVPMRMEVTFRFDYANVMPWVTRAADGLGAIVGPDGVALRMPVPRQGRDMPAVAEFTVTEGQTVPFVLTWFPSHHSEPPEIDPQERLAATETWWQDWSAQCTYDGPWREAVLRSLVTLKALTFSPTGGIVAAPTTSLPEQIGGVRNWDYRYCWLRDATFTLLALLGSGFKEEASAWRDWLLRAVAGDPSKLQILYGLGGERRSYETELPWLPGYENSRPVRAGNAAHTQFQLDVYGEIMDAFYLARREQVPARKEGWQVARAMLGFLEEAWQRPDEGIWEVHGPRRDFTHSKMMAWVAFDRAVKAIESFGLDGPLERWRAVRDAIHADVCRRGFNAKRGAFTWYYGSKDLDAALLLMPQIGFLPADDGRVAGTVEAIQRELKRDGLVRRYSSDPAVDGLPPGEGAFLACSFWLVDDLALMGRYDEARAPFETLLSLRNDVGLLAEEYDPVLRRQVGNFPQAFSHVALVNSAHNLYKAAGPARARAAAE